MSRKYPKKVRKAYAAKLKAADAFVETWTTTGLAFTLISDYSCTLTCEEAESFSGLYRSFGYVSTAETILADHGEDCDTPHYHEPQGVWTFAVEAEFTNGEKDEWTIVADGSGAEAEDKAVQFVRSRLKAQGRRPWFVTAGVAENGIPASTALYAWTDIREAA